MGFLRRFLNKGEKALQHAFLFLILPLSLSCFPVSFASKETATSEKEGDSLPDGKDPESKFLNSLRSLDGVYGTLSLEANVLDKNMTTSSSFKLEDADLGFVYKEEDKALHLEGRLLYNESDLPYSIHYGNEEAYLSLLGARYSYKTTDFDTLFDSLVSIFGTDWVKVPDALYDSILPLLKSMDGEMELPNLRLRAKAGRGYTFELPLSGSISGYLLFNADSSYNLLSFETENLSFEGGSLSASFLNKEVEDTLKTILSKAPTDASSYTPVIDSMGLVERLASLSKDPKGTLLIEGDIDNQTHFPGNEALEESFDLNGEISFDIKKQTFHGSIEAGGTDFDGTHGSTNLSFFNEPGEDGYWKGFLSYNDIMKLSMDSLVYNELLALFEDELTSTGILDTITNILTDATALTEIKDGRYGKLLASVLSLESDSDSLILALNLKYFGMGDNSLLRLTLLGEKKGLSTAIFENLEVGTAVFKKLSLTLDAYKEASFDTKDYFELTELPTLASQMKSLFNEQRAHVSFDFNIMNEDGSGYPTFSGEAYFDAKKKAGTGDITLYHKINDSLHKNHRVKIDVTGGEDSDVTRFHYYDGDSNNEGMRGQMTIKDLNDIIALAVGLYNEDDPRFAKFFDPIRLAMASSAFGAISAGRYGPFLASKLLLSASFSSTQSSFVFDGAGFGMEEGSQWALLLNYEAGKLTSIGVKDINMSGRLINGTLTLLGTSFDDSKLSSVDFANKNYYQFDGVDKLLSSALNESKRETFRIYSKSLSVTLAAIGIKAVTLNLGVDISIYVKGEVVKVYGTINNSDYTGVILNMTPFRRYKTAISDRKGKVISSIYYDNIDVAESKKQGKEIALPDQKGYLHVSTLTQYEYLEWFKWHTFSQTDEVKYNTDQLSDSKTVVNLIFWDILSLNMKSYYDDMLNKEPAATAYENILTGYNYAIDGSGIPTWTLGVNLGVLANTDVLTKMSLSLKGTVDGYIDGIEIPNQAFLSMGAGALKGSLQASLVNEAPGKDYWSGTAANAWSSYLTEARRAKDVTAV